MEPARLYVGTIGQSVWRSLDGGLTFARASRGLHSESDVRALLAHPHRPEFLLAGTETGLFRTDDGAESWRRVPSPMDGSQVWSLARDPRSPERLYAGTSPARLYASEDGGETWRELPAGMPDRCVNDAPLSPRVTCILPDSVDAALFVGVEIAGVFRSRDGGRTWSSHLAGLSSPDIHGLAAVRAGGRRVLLATTNNDVNRSDDDGESWSPLGIGRVFPWTYARACVVDPGDPSRVWIGAGNGPPGDAGGLFATRDLGATWERLPLPGTANSTVWSIAFHPENPSLVYVASISGQIYRSGDAGGTWERLPREFGEVRSLCVVPG